jgi:hypothetical protein
MLFVAVGLTRHTHSAFEFAINVHHVFFYKFVNSFQFLNKIFVIRDLCFMVKMKTIPFYVYIINGF